MNRTLPFAICGMRFEPSLRAFVPPCARAFLFILLPSSFILCYCVGCGAVGALAHAVPQYKAPAYSGLSGQPVGVMVWADRGVRIDWSSIQFDLANLLQDKLQKSDAKELKGVTWPVLPASIVRYQRDHPGIEAMPITDVAPKLGVSRLIYVEIEGFSTRSESSLQMFRGNAIATLKIVEVNGGEAKVAYQENGVRAFFPAKSPPEGILNANDALMYRGTVVALADEIVKRLTTYEIKPGE